MPELLLGSKYGRRLHFWDLQKRKHVQEIDFGPDYQLVFELRPAHDPTKAYGFVNAVLCLKDLSSSIWVWYRDGDKWAVKKVIDIPAEPAEPDQLPPVHQGLQGLPAPGHRHRPVGRRQVPLRGVLGHGRSPAVRRVRSVQPEAHRQAPDRRHRRARAGHPSGKGPLNGGPQMVEVSRDGKRIYFTNSLYGDDRRPVLSRTASRAGWSRSTPSRAAASSWTRSSSWSGRMATGRTRCACRAATPRRTRTAIRDGAALIGGGRPGRGPAR